MDERPVNDSRSDLRNRLSAARSELEDSALEAAADGFASRLVAHLDDRPIGTVAGYMAMRGELDPAPALRALHARTWRIVLPVIGPDITLTFAPWIPDRTDFIRNRFGIDEPDGPAVDPTQIDVVVTPGVAFDTVGGRLGHGAGFYDRFFARLDQAAHRPHRIGAAHELQVVDHVPTQPWDVPMDAVITPARIIFTSPSPMDEP